MLAKCSFGHAAIRDEIGYGDPSTRILPDVVDRLSQVVRQRPATRYPATIELIQQFHGSYPTPPLARSDTRYTRSGTRLIGTSNLTEIEPCGQIWAVCGYRGRKRISRAIRLSHYWLVAAREPRASR